MKVPLAAFDLLSLSRAVSCKPRWHHFYEKESILEFTSQRTIRFLCLFFYKTRYTEIAELFPAPLFNRFASPRHQSHIEVKIVNGVQTTAENFSTEKQMPKISARVISASVTIALGI